MTPVQMFVTVAAGLCGLVAATFCVLYAQTRKGRRRLWWETVTGRSIMALGACLALLAAGTVTRRLIPDHEAGNVILGVAYLLVAAVMAWRTVMMWAANHPNQKKEN